MSKQENFFGRESCQNAHMIEFFMHTTTTLQHRKNINHKPLCFGNTEEEKLAQWDKTLLNKHFINKDITKKFSKKPQLAT